jgi:hypothetical protein
MALWLNLQTRNMIRKSHTPGAHVQGYCIVDRSMNLLEDDSHRHAMTEITPTSKSTISIKMKSPGNIGRD